MKQKYKKVALKYIVALKCNIFDKELYNQTPTRRDRREKSMEIKNAIIESTTLDISDRGFLTCWIYLDYGGASQGFGGYVLYLPKSFTHHQLLSHAGHFIQRSMEVAGAGKWDQMKGKTVRVKIDNTGMAVAIGHIVKEDWFEPQIDFKKD